jgi:hypothetical protein
MTRGGGVRPGNSIRRTHAAPPTLRSPTAMPAPERDCLLAAPRSGGVF